MHPDDSVLGDRPAHQKIELLRAAKGDPLSVVVPSVLVQARIRPSLAARSDFADILCERIRVATGTLTGEALGATNSELEFCKARGKGYNAADGHS